MIEQGTLAGLRFESDFPLPGLAAPNMLQREWGRVRIRRVSFDEIGRQARADPRAISMEPGQPGSFLITGPDEILVVPAAIAADRSIFAYLFGPCMAVIAYRNHILPLHASAIETGHGCVGFVGSSGAGKSTLVAALSRRGHVILTDDVCLSRRMSHDTVLSWPGIRWLRLTQDSAKALQHAHAPQLPAGKKYSFELPSLHDPAAPRQLRAIYVLEASSAGGAACVVRLTGARAAERVIANIYRPPLVRQLGLWREVVPECVAFAERVPIYLFRRALDFQQMDVTLDVLERHIDAQPMDAARS